MRGVCEQARPPEWLPWRRQADQRPGGRAGPFSGPGLLAAPGDCQALQPTPGGTQEVFTVGGDARETRKCRQMVSQKE